MKNILFAVCSIISLSFTTWEHDFEKAKQVAKEKHQLILLNFSGSDWCGPCIRMRKEIFDSRAFSDMADSNVVLVNADFPRNKKNQLSKQARQQNESLAEIYNPDGKFPFTLLLNGDGKVIRSWDGLPNEDVVQFTEQIKRICNANK